MTEIQGKSILVRVSARFELARVRVIESRLYLSSTDPFADVTLGKIDEATRESSLIDLTDSEREID